MVTAILTHEVKNYDTWRVGFDADGGNREKMGVKVSGVYRSVENPNVISVITEVPSLESIQKFIASPDLHAAMEHAGVVGKPDFKILNKV